MRCTYDVWYYALTNTYFCLAQRMPLGIRLVDVLAHLSKLRPYPARGTRHYYDCIYAVTHLVYTLNAYGRWRLSPRMLSREFRFLKASIGWAIEQREADTVGEVVESLTALGLADSDPLVSQGRAFLLQTQREDGGWGDKNGDDYGYFHTLWTAIDALRDYRWRGTRALPPAVLRVLHE